MIRSLFLPMELLRVNERPKVSHVSCRIFSQDKESHAVSWLDPFQRKNSFASASSARVLLILLNEYS